MGKIIGIVGSRNRENPNTLLKILEVFDVIYQPGDWICSGGCSRGADSFAHYIHLDRKLPYLEFPADWKTHGKRAGFVCNTDIAKFSDVLIAAPGDPGHGTRDTIKKFVEFHGEENLHII